MVYLYFAGITLLILLLIKKTKNNKPKQTQTTKPNKIQSTNVTSLIFQWKSLEDEKKVLYITSKLWNI